MGSAEGARCLGREQLFTCPYCGLPQERVPTLDDGTVMLEPDMMVAAHLVPADHRWIVLPDGQVAMYGVSPVDGAQRCRLEHRLACPRQELPDLWQWLTTLREENARRSERLPDPPSPREPDEGLPEVG
ncbi:MULTISPECIES: DUF6083 domain-containing protein [unclassified Streptomyces]|nr:MULTISPECIES: DUF6083 domain-containing protein [unclassified Streptomyces]